MRADSVFNYMDNDQIKHNVAIREAVVASYYDMRDSLKRASLKGNKDSLLWYAEKNTSITHLTKIPAFSYANLNIGGWGNTVNAAKGDHGPSWRMVVQMGKEIEAYGVYPGGQSGNPGSKYYGNFINDWAAGQYYRLLFLPATDKQDSKQLLYTINAHP
jgi:penicillin amidase